MFLDFQSCENSLQRLLFIEEVHAQDKVVNQVKMPLKTINKLDLSCKASLAAILVTFHQNSCKKIGQKACLNITQVEEQVAAEIGATLGCELSTRYYFCRFALSG